MTAISDNSLELDTRHHMFLNLVLRGKIHKAVKFVCKWKTGRVFLPEELVTYKMGVTEETIELVLAKKKHPTPPSRCSTLEVYDETPILLR